MSIFIGFEKRKFRVIFSLQNNKRMEKAQDARTHPLLKDDLSYSTPPNPNTDGEIKNQAWIIDKEKGSIPTLSRSIFCHVIITAFAF